LGCQFRKLAKAKYSANKKADITMICRDFGKSRLTREGQSRPCLQALLQGGHLGRILSSLGIGVAPHLAGRQSNKKM
jgi:hypothetical protein